MHTSPHATLVATNLMAARQARHLTQAAVAEAIGASQDQVSKWERGVVTPSPRWQSRLADFYFAGELAALYREPIGEAA